MKYSMLKGLQCIIRRFSNRGSHVEVFEREGEVRESRLAIPLAIKESGLFYNIYSNKLCLSSTSNVLFPLRFNTASPLNLCQSRQNLVANLRLLSFF